MKLVVGLYVENISLRSELEKFIVGMGHSCDGSPPVGATSEILVTDQSNLDLPKPSILISPQVDFEIFYERLIQGPQIWISEFKQEEFIEIMTQLSEEILAIRNPLTYSKEIDRRNQNQEDINDQMQAIVDQRTEDLLAEKKKADFKHKESRRLADFVRSLTETETMADYLMILRKELRSRFAVSEVYIESMFVFDRVEKVRANLANKFGRPIGKVYSVKLKGLNLIANNSNDYLLVEHGIEERHMAEFEDFVSARIPIINVAFERIHLLSELTKSCLEWEQTFDSLKDPVGIVDVDFKILRSNRSFGESAFKAQCHKVFALMEHPCEGCPVPDTVHSARPRSSEIRRFGKHYRVHSYPIHNSQDRMVTTTVNHYVDISEDRQLYSRVIQHEKMSALGIMAGHIAHELNNPLTGIRSLCQILSQSEVSSQLKKDLVEVELATKRCQDIIKNLLDFTSTNDTRAQPVSLGEIVRKTLPLLKTSMKYHSVDVDLDPNEKLIVASEQLLQQVVFNLVNNSCQAMKEPGEVRISTRTLEKRSFLWIDDSGPGIPKENIDRLFEAFFTTKPQGEGTGLGLSMSKSIVERFGGKIELKATSPKGTSFEISFPVEP